MERVSYRGRMKLTDTLTSLRVPWFETSLGIPFPHFLQYIKARACDKIGRDLLIMILLDVTWFHLLEGPQ